MWWFRALRANLLVMLRHAGAAERRLILDAGCGTGGFLAHLSRTMPGWPAVGIDRDAEACRLAREKSGCPVCVGSVDRLPFADGALAGILSADVLCHAGADEAASLADFYRCLMPGGVVVLNLPAYPWLMSGHDRAVHNARRYTAARLRRLLAGAGFRVARTSYWNSILFPLMVVRRLLPLGRGGEGDVRRYPAAADSLFGFLTGVETMLLNGGCRLPFGGSILAVAVKP